MANDILNKNIKTVSAKLLTVVIVVGAIVVGGGMYLYTGKAHNPVTHMASEIIERETGIDIEAMLSDEEESPQCIHELLQ